MALAPTTGFKIDAKRIRFVKRAEIISVVPMKTQVLQGAGSADMLPMRFGCPAALAVLLILLPVP